MAKATAGLPPEASPVQANVHVTGRRVLATIVDWILLSIIAGIALIPFFILRSQVGETAASIYDALYFSMLLVVFVAYYIVFETRWGQTVGKAVCSIKVIDESTGQAPGLQAVAVRTVLRLVEGPITYYLVAFIAVLVSNKRQRLGDMAAGTQVVRERPTRPVPSVHHDTWRAQR